MAKKNFAVFNKSLQGASHVKRGVKCQDCSFCGTLDEEYFIIVADGHGGRKHFRSDRGAIIACNSAAQKIWEYMRAPREIPDLMSEIIKLWRAEVDKDVAKYPWGKRELEEQKELLTEERFIELVNGKNNYTPYGCTFVAAFTHGDEFIAMQIGDGAFALVTDDGYYSWPMPESNYNDGNKTYSLCADNPMLDFRFVKGQGQPLAMFVYSDGIEKTYPNNGRDIIVLLDRLVVLHKGDSENKEAVVNKGLQYVTDNSESGDDVSIAGMINLSCEYVKPRPSPIQLEKEKNALLAQLREIENTISYNSDRRGDLSGNTFVYNSTAINQIDEIIARKQKEAEELRNRITEIDAKLQEFGEFDTGDNTMSSLFDDDQD